MNRKRAEPWALWGINVFMGRGAIFDIACLGLVKFSVLFVYVAVVFRKCSVRRKRLFLLTFLLFKCQSSDVL